MKQVLDAHFVICAAEDMADAIVQSDFNDTQHQTHQSAEFVVYLSLDTISEIKHALAILSVVEEASVRARV